MSPNSLSAFQEISPLPQVYKLNSRISRNNPTLALLNWRLIQFTCPRLTSLKSVWFICGRIDKFWSRSTARNFSSFLKKRESYKGKGQAHPRTGHKGPEGQKMYSSTFSLTSALDVVGWSTPRPGHFIPEKDPVPIVQDTGLTPGPIWTGAENLAS